MAKKPVSKAKRRAIELAFRAARFTSEKRMSKNVKKFMIGQSERIDSSIEKELKKVKGLDKKAESKFTKKQSDKIAKKVVDESIDWTIENTLFAKIMTPLMANAAKLGADVSEKVFDVLKGDKKLLGIRNDSLIKFARTEGSKKVRGINERTQNKLRKNIANGLINGESLPQIMERVQSVTKINKTSRVRTIARTESHISITTGNFTNMEVGGVKKVKWVTSKDELVRGNPSGKYPDSLANHFILDGDIIELGGRFSNGLRYPGDPDGGPGDIINCRCFLASADF